MKYRNNNTLAMCSSMVLTNHDLLNHELAIEMVKLKNLSKPIDNLF